MNDVNAFISNGSVNSENFYISEEPAEPGTARISVGGIFDFSILLSAPFTVSVPQTHSRALAKFVSKVNATPSASAADTLKRTTPAYLAISDELDAENQVEEEEGVPGVEEDLLEQMNKQAAADLLAARQKQVQSLKDQWEAIQAQYDVAALPKPAIDRILSDLELVKAAKRDGWTAEPSGRNLSLWKVELFEFDKGTQLDKDLREVAKRTGKAAIEMTMQFPKEYPFKPPFIRVIRPRFVARTGRVTVGGSICTQVLTEDGWTPVYTVEGLIVGIRSQISDPDAKAQVDHSNTSDYSEAEAREAFVRVAEYHKQNGW